MSCGPGAVSTTGIPTRSRGSLAGHWVEGEAGENFQVGESHP